MLIDLGQWDPEQLGARLSADFVLDPVQSPRDGVPAQQVATETMHESQHCFAKLRTRLVPAG